MLWRVGCGCRQSLRQAVQPRISCLRHYSLCLPLERPVHLQWPTGLGFLHAIQHVKFPNNRRSMLSLAVADVNTATEAPTSNQIPAAASEAPTPHVPKFRLPPELLSMIDSTAVWNSGKRAASRQLRSAGGERVIRIFHDGRQIGRMAAQMVGTEVPRRALHVLALAHRFGTPLRLDLYEQVARRLVEAGEWGLVPPLVAMTRRHMGRVTARLLDWQTQSFIRTGQFASLDHTLERYEKEGVQPGRRSYHILVSGHIRNHNLSKAMEVLRYMEQAGFPVDPNTHVAVSAAYRALGPDAAVQLQALQALGHADPQTSARILNAVVQLCVDANDAERIALLFGLFDLKGLDLSPLLRPDGSTSLRGVDSGALSKEIRKTISLLRISETSSISPDIATYTILLNYATYRRDLHSADAIIQHLLRIGVVPDNRFAAAVIRLQFAVDRPGTALHMLSRFCADNAEAQACLKKLRFTPIKQEKSHLHAIHATPTTEIMNAFVDGVLRIRGLNGLHVVLRLMLVCSVRPDARTAELFLTYLERSESVHPSEILDALRSTLADFLSPTLGQLSVFYRAVLRREVRRVKRSGWNNAELLLPSSRDPSKHRPGTTGTEFGPFDPTAGLEPPPVPHRRAVLQSLTQRGIRSDRAMLALRIRHEAVTKSDMHTAKTVFQSMLDRGMHPTEYHYSALMEGYVAGGDFEAAESVMRAAVKARVTPTRVMHTILIVGYARHANPDGAMTAFGDMVAAGINPDTASVDAIVGAFFAAGATKLARRTLLNLWAYVGPYPTDIQDASLETLRQEFLLRNRGANERRSMVARDRKYLKWKLMKLDAVWKYFSLRRMVNARSIDPPAELQPGDDCNTKSP